YMSTRLVPRRQRARAPCRQQPGQQPHSGERHPATERLPPTRRHDDRAPPAVVLNDTWQVSSVTGEAGQVVGRSRRVVPVQARLTGHVPVPISAAKCFELLDAYVELELARGAADAGMPLMRARLRGCSACRDDHESPDLPYSFGAATWE